MAAKDPLWIEHMHMQPGKFSAKAKKAGMPTGRYAEQKADAPGTLGHEARLAETLSNLRKGKRYGE